MNTKKHIQDRKDVFNQLVNDTIKDKENYLTKLLNFAKDNYYVDELRVSNAIENLKNQIMLYIINNENIDYDIDMIGTREKMLSDILYSIDNYLLDYEPYDALDMFLNGDTNNLIMLSLDYYDNYKKELFNELDEIIKLTKYEYDNGIFYKKGIDALRFKINARENILEDQNLCMHNFKTNANNPLYIQKKYIDNLLIEAKIINKFDIKSRMYIIKKLNNHIEFQSICEIMLINYSLLSIYSDTPDDLKVSESMLNILTKEIINGIVTIEELDDYIINGKIKFEKDEIEYIKKYFNKVVLNNNNEVEKSLFLKLL